LLFLRVAGGRGGRGFRPDDLLFGLFFFHQWDRLPRFLGWKLNFLLLLLDLLLHLRGGLAAQKGFLALDRGSVETKTFVGLHCGRGDDRQVIVSAARLQSGQVGLMRSRKNEKAKRRYVHAKSGACRSKANPIHCAALARGVAACGLACESCACERSESR
jgi:hypothetical protein